MILFPGWKDYSRETISTDVQSGEGRTNNQDTCLNSIIDNHNKGWDKWRRLKTLQIWQSQD